MIAERDSRRDAAEWLARRQSGMLDPEDAQRFEEWQARPGNAHAYASLVALNDALDAVADDDALMKARQQAIRRARQRRPIARFALAASVAAVIGLSGAWFAFGRAEHGPRDEIFATRVGQGATVTLADRTKMTLDADTALAVHITDKERLIELRHGRAYFVVAKDVHRPFIVRTQMGAVRATGTAFSVRAAKTALDVVLQQGSVNVGLDRRLTKDDRDVVISMRAGTRLVADPQSWSLKPTAPDTAIAWTRGFVVFDNTPLAEAAEEMNAYTAQKLIARPSIAARPISGTFRIGRPQDFARALEAYGIARIVSATPDKIVMEAAPKIIQPTG